MRTTPMGWGLLPNVRVRDNCTKDDLGPARGTVIAAILGLACWATIFIIGQWMFA
jgi:hypothetical protein